MSWEITLETMRKVDLEVIELFENIWLIFLIINTIMVFSVCLTLLAEYNLTSGSQITFACSLEFQPSI